MKIKVFGVGFVLVVLMIIFLTLTSCAKLADAPETRCFTTPHLHCDVASNSDGDL